MTYAMTLDNSWEIMNEEEMYDVNGGGWYSDKVAKVVKMFGDVVVGTLALAFGLNAAKTMYAGLSLVRGFKDILTAVKLAVFNWQVAVGFVAVVVAMAYAIYVY